KTATRSKSRRSAGSSFFPPFSITPPLRLRPMRVRWLWVPAAATALSLHAPVGAQVPVSKQDLRNFTPPTDPEATLYLEKPTGEGAGAYNVGVWFSYANQLLVVESAGSAETSPVAHQLSVDYVASLGFTERITLGIALPTVVYQRGDNEELLAGDDPLPQSAFGDLRADLMATLLDPGTVGTRARAGRARGARAASCG